MSKILFPLALSVVMFIAAGPIDAAGKGGSSKGSGGASKGSGSAKSGTGKAAAGNKGNVSGVNKGLGSGKGTKFDHGICYRGRDHNHWGARRFDSRYGCDCYWDPYVLEWYYWCEPDLCFYPVSYCPYGVYAFPQTVVVPQGGVVPNNPIRVVQPSANVPPIPVPMIRR